jgi:16S rRNA (guanine527-N7)-methyltransferase
METLAAEAQAYGFRLTPDQEQLFTVYARELVAWNLRANLTSIAEPHDIQVKHFLDSLTCLLAIPAELEVRTVLDVGSGAGFPGLPIKIYDPSLEVTLLESVGKKTDFLRHMAGILNYQGLCVVNGRAEALGQDPAHREKYDLVLARAVAELAILSEYCLPFCRVGGVFIAQKKAAIDAEIRNATGAIATLGGELRRQLPVTLPRAESRQLLVIVKTSPTPPRYPRRPGVPAKRPLI